MHPTTANDTAGVTQVDLLVMGLTDRRLLIEAYASVLTVLQRCPPMVASG